MPLLLLRFSEINLTAWDACVQASPSRGGLPYAFSWWLQLTAGRWDAVVEPDGRGGYASVLPLPVRRRPWGPEVVQPLYTQQLGLLLTADSQVLGQLPVLAARYARFYTQLGAAQPWPALPPELAVRVQERRNYVLSLAPPYPTLLAGYHASFRRRLRRQPLGPGQVQAGQSVAALIDLFRQNKGREIPSLKPRHYRRLARLLTAVQERGELLLLELREPETDELLTSAVFVRQPGVLVYLLSATSAAGRAAAGPLRIFDFLIQMHAGTPDLTLDFEGSLLPGVARFFANFGAAPVSYAALTSLRQPWLLRLIQWMRP